MEITNQVKLSQWDALMLESLRAHGYSNEELIRKVKAGELPKDESEFQFDYHALTAFAAEHSDVFEAAVLQGYQIKYNTVRGIRCWILIRFKKDPELLLETGGEAVHASLTSTEKDELTSVLSFGWGVHEERPASNAEAGLFRIEPIQR